MGADIHVVLEVRENGEWKVTKEKDEFNWAFYKSKIDEIKADPALEMKSTFDGRLEFFEEGLKRFEKSPFWVNPPRNYLLFSILSNVRNYDGIYPYTEGYEFEETFSYPEVSKEAEKLFDGEDFFHSHTIIFGNEIKEVYETIEKNRKSEKLDSDLIESVKAVFEKYFENNLKLFLDKGYKEHEVRFLIAYDN